MASTMAEIAVSGGPCARCHQPPGQGCVTVKGHAPGTRLSHPHAERMRPVEAGWRLGFVAGRSDQTDAIRRRLEQERVCSADQLERVTRLWP